MTNEIYEYWLQASAGGTTATLKMYENKQVECELHWGGMGTPYHYRLTGTCEPFSETYGLIRIHQVQDVLQPSAAPLPIEVLGAELIYEYIKLPQNPFWRHSGDALWVNGRWNEFFDLILLTSDFVVECFESLKYAIAEGIIEETEPPETVALINDALIQQFARLIVGLDKRKFAKSEPKIS